MTLSLKSIITIAASLVYASTNAQTVSVIDIFHNVSPKRLVSGHIVTTNIYRRRMAAVKLLHIETDTGRLKKFIVIDYGNLEGADYIGEMIIDDTVKYFYRSGYITKGGIHMIPDTAALTPATEAFILRYLTKHRFAELEAIARERSKTTSGSGFYSIGMYEKNMQSSYIGTMPSFIILDDK